MIAYLVRHARAVDADYDLDDAHRWLTPDGRRCARAVGERLAALGCRPAHVVTSPLVRAVQTAELLLSGLGSDAPVSTLAALAPGLPPRLVEAGLVQLVGPLLVVGHEPSITALGSHLTGGRPFPPFQVTQVALVERGKLAWSRTPADLGVR